MRERTLTQDVWVRLHELEDRLDDPTWRRFANELEEHSAEPATLCPRCAEEAPCAVVRAFAVVLRAYDVRRATRAAAALADEVRAAGAEILTVLRRPQLDTVGGRERYAFELVYPEGALGILVSGHTAEEHRLGRCLREGDHTVPRISHVGQMLTWEELVKTLTRALARIRDFAQGAAA